MNFYLLIILSSSILLFGCVNDKNQKEQEKLISLETFNRNMFNFNYNMLDPYVIRPAAIFWRNYMPISARNGLKNFFINLEEPATMVNYFIEGKPYKAMVHFNRFFLNTMLGMGGFIDVASIANSKLAMNETLRFGSVLDNYGISCDPYIYLPIYGSFTFREDIGNLVDTFYPLLSYLTWWMSISKWTLESLETRAQLLDLDNLIYKSQDPYATIRTIYFQKHNLLSINKTLNQKQNLNETKIQEDLNSIDF